MSKSKDTLGVLPVAIPTVQKKISYPTISYPSDVFYDNSPSMMNLIDKVYEEAIAIDSTYKKEDVRGIINWKILDGIPLDDPLDDTDMQAGNVFTHLEKTKFSEKRSDYFHPKYDSNGYLIMTPNFGRFDDASIDFTSIKGIATNYNINLNKATNKDIKEGITLTEDLIKKYGSIENAKKSASQEELDKIKNLATEYRPIPLENLTKENISDFYDTANDKEKRQLEIAAANNVLEQENRKILLNMNLSTKQLFYKDLLFSSYNNIVSAIPFIPQHVGSVDYQVNMNNVQIANSILKEPKAKETLKQIKDLQEKISTKPLRLQDGETPDNDIAKLKFLKKEYENIINKDIPKVKGIKDLYKSFDNTFNHTVELAGNTIGGSLGFLVTLSAGSTALKGIGKINKFKKLGELLNKAEKLQESDNEFKFLANAKESGLFNSIGKQFVKYGKRLGGSSIEAMLTQSPAGITDAIANQVYKEKDATFANIVYDALLNRQLEVLSEAMWIEGKATNRIGKKAIKALYDVIPNTMTEEVTNLAQDYFEGTKTSIYNLHTGSFDWSNFQWGDAQNGAIIMGVTFGLFGFGSTMVGQTYIKSKAKKKSLSTLARFAFENRNANNQLISNEIKTQLFGSENKDIVENMSEVESLLFSELSQGQKSLKVNTPMGKNSIELDDKEQAKSDELNKGYQEKLLQIKDKLKNTKKKVSDDAFQIASDIMKGRSDLESKGLFSAREDEYNAYKDDVNANVIVDFAKELSNELSDKLDTRGKVIENRLSEYNLEDKVSSIMKAGIIRNKKFEQLQFSSEVKKEFKDNQEKEIEYKKIYETELKNSDKLQLKNIDIGSEQLRKLLLNKVSIFAIDRYSKVKLKKEMQAGVDLILKYADDSKLKEADDISTNKQLKALYLLAQQYNHRDANDPINELAIKAEILIGNYHNANEKLHEYHAKQGDIIKLEKTKEVKEYLDSIKDSNIRELTVDAMKNEYADRYSKKIADKLFELLDKEIKIEDVYEILKSDDIENKLTELAKIDLEAPIKDLIRSYRYIINIIETAHKQTTQKVKENKTKENVKVAKESKDTKHLLGLNFDKNKFNNRNRIFGLTPTIQNYLYNILDLKNEDIIFDVNDDDTIRLLKRKLEENKINRQDILLLVGALNEPTKVIALLNDEELTIIKDSLQEKSQYISKFYDISKDELLNVKGLFDSLTTKEEISNVYDLIHTQDLNEFRKKIVNLNIELLFQLSNPTLEFSFFGEKYKINTPAFEGYKHNYTNKKYAAYINIYNNSLLKLLEVKIGITNLDFINESELKSTNESVILQNYIEAIIKLTKDNPNDIEYEEAKEIENERIANNPEPTDDINSKTLSITIEHNRKLKDTITDTFNSLVELFDSDNLNKSYESIKKFIEENSEKDVKNLISYLIYNTDLDKSNPRLKSNDPLLLGQFKMLLNLFSNRGTNKKKKLDYILGENDEEFIKLDTFEIINNHQDSIKNKYEYSKYFQQIYKKAFDKPYLSEIEDLLHKKSYSEGIEDEYDIYKAYLEYHYAIALDEFTFKQTNLFEGFPLLSKPIQFLIKMNLGYNSETINEIDALEDLQMLYSISSTEKTNFTSKPHELSNASKGTIFDYLEMHIRKIRKDIDKLEKLRNDLIKASIQINDNRKEEITKAISLADKFIGLLSNDKEESTAPTIEDTQTSPNSIEDTKDTLVKDKLFKKPTRAMAEFKDEHPQLIALLEEKGYTIRTGEIEKKGTHNSLVKSITIKRGMSYKMQKLVLYHEIGHALFGLALDIKINEPHIKNLYKIITTMQRLFSRVIKGEFEIQSIKDYKDYGTLSKVEQTKIKNKIKYHNKHLKKKLSDIKEEYFIDSVNEKELLELLKDIKNNPDNYLNIVPKLDGKFKRNRMVSELYANAIGETSSQFSHLLTKLKQVNGINTESKSNIFSQYLSELINIFKNIASHFDKNKETLYNQIMDVADSMVYSSTEYEDNYPFPNTKDKIDNQFNHEIDLDGLDSFPEITVAESMDSEGETYLDYNAILSLTEEMIKMNEIKYNGLTFNQIMESITYKEFDDLFFRGSKEPGVNRLRKRLLERLRRGLDYKHASYELDEFDIEKARVSYLYTYLKNLKKVSYVDIVMSNGNIRIKKREGHFKNTKGARVSDISNKIQLDNMIDDIAKVLGTKKFKLVRVNEFYKEDIRINPNVDIENLSPSQLNKYTTKKSGFSFLKDKTTEISRAAWDAGYIYLNQFADRKTNILIKFDEIQRDKILNRIKDLFELFDNQLENGYKYEEKSDILEKNIAELQTEITSQEAVYEDAKQKVRDARKRAIREEEKDFLIKTRDIEEEHLNTLKKELKGNKFKLSFVEGKLATLTMRTFLEHLKLNGEVNYNDDNTIQDIGISPLKDRDFVILTKRWVLSSQLVKPIYYKDLGKYSTILNDKRGVVEKEINGKKELFMKAVFWNSNDFKNNTNVSRMDGALIITKNVGRILRLLNGITNAGSLKNYYFNEGLYLKQAMHEYDNNPLTDIMNEHDIGIIINETTEKNFGLSKNKYYSLEEIKNGKAETVLIPFDKFNKIKEGSNVHTTAIGLSQIFNATNIIDENSWVDKSINTYFHKLAKKSIEEINDLDTLEVNRLIKNKINSLRLKPSNYKEELLVELLNKLRPSVKNDNWLDALSKFSFYEPVAQAFSYILNDNIKSAVKARNLGADVTLMPDMGDLIGTKDTVIKQIALEMLKDNKNANIKSLLSKLDIYNDLIKNNRSKLSSRNYERNKLVSKVKRFRRMKQEVINDIEKTTKFKESLLKAEKEAEKYFDEKGFIKFGYGLITEDVSERLDIQHGDDLAYYLIPSDSAMSISSVKVIGIINNNDMSHNGFVTNSEYLQSAIGRDYDIDVMYLIPKPIEFNDEEWTDFNKKLKDIYHSYVNGMHDTFKYVFNNIDVDKIETQSLGSDAETIKNKDKILKSFDDDIASFEEEIKSNEEKIHEFDNVQGKKDILEYKKATIKVRKLNKKIHDMEITKSKFEFKVKKLESEVGNNAKNNVALEIAEIKKIADKFKDDNLELYQKMELIFDENIRKRFMQAILGIETKNRPQNQKYSPIEEDTIKVGGMFTKEIGAVIILRERFSALTLLKYEDKDEGIEFNKGINWDIVHTMLMVATNDMVDYPKNSNKNYYRSSIDNIFLHMLSLDLHDNSLEYKGGLIGKAKGKLSDFTKLTSIPRAKSDINDSITRVTKIDTTRMLRSIFELKRDRNKVQKYSKMPIYDLLNINEKKIKNYVSKLLKAYTLEESIEIVRKVDFEIQKEFFSKIFNVDMENFVSAIKEIYKLNDSFNLARNMNIDNYHTIAPMVNLADFSKDFQVKKEVIDELEDSDILYEFARHIVKYYKRPYDEKRIKKDSPFRTLEGIVSIFRPGSPRERLEFESSPDVWSAMLSIMLDKSNLILKNPKRITKLIGSKENLELDGENSEVRLLDKNGNIIETANFGLVRVNSKIENWLKDYSNFDIETARRLAKDIVIDSTNFTEIDRINLAIKYFKDRIEVAKHDDVKIKLILTALLGHLSQKALEMKSIFKARSKDRKGTLIIGKSINPFRILTSDRILAIAKEINPDFLEKYNELFIKYVGLYAQNPTISDIYSSKKRGEYVSVDDRTPYNEDIDNFPDINLTQHTNGNIDFKASRSTKEFGLIFEKDIEKGKKILQNELYKIEFINSLIKHNLSFFNFKKLPNDKKEIIFDSMNLENISYISNSIENLESKDLILAKRMYYQYRRVTKNIVSIKDGKRRWDSQINMDILAIFYSKPLFNIDKESVPELIRSTFSMSNFDLDMNNVAINAQVGVRNPSMQGGLYSLTDIFYTKTHLLQDTTSKIKASAMAKLSNLRSHMNTLSEADKIKHSKNVQEILKKIAIMEGLTYNTRTKEWRYFLRKSEKTDSSKDEEIFSSMLDLVNSEYFDGEYTAKEINHAEDLRNLLREDFGKTFAKLIEFSTNLMNKSDNEIAKAKYKRTINKYRMMFYKIKNGDIEDTGKFDYNNKNRIPTIQFIPRLIPKEVYRSILIKNAETTMANLLIRKKVSGPEYKTQLENRITNIDNYVNDVLHNKEEINTLYDERLTDTDRYDLFENPRIDLAFIDAIENITKDIHSEIMTLYSQQYMYGAIKYGETAFVIDKMKKLFIGEGVKNKIKTTSMKLEDVKGGDIISYNIKKELKHDEGADETFTYIEKTSKIKEVDLENRDYIIEERGEDKILPFDDIISLGYDGEVIPGAVDIYTTFKEGSDKLTKGFLRLTTTVTTSLRGYLSVLKSYTQNKIGVYPQGAMFSMGLATRMFSSKKLARAVGDIVKEEGKADEYAEIVASINTLNQKILIDLLTGTGDTDFEAYKILGKDEQNPNLIRKWKNEISNYRKVKKIAKDSKGYDIFLDELIKLDKKIIDNPKDESLRIIRKSINKLAYKEQIDQEELLSKVKDYDEVLYKRAKEMIDSGNLAFMYKINSAQSAYILKKYKEDIYRNNRLKFINSIESEIRLKTFHSRFLYSMKLYNNVEMAFLHGKQAVKVDHALYSALDKVVSASTDRGRAMQALRQFAYNQNLTLIRLLMTVKSDIETYKLKTLLKDLIPYMEKMDDHNSLRQLANFMIVNHMLFTVAQLTGLQALRYFMNPAIGAIYSLVEMMIYANGDDEEIRNKFNTYKYPIISVTQNFTGLGFGILSTMFYTLTEFMTNDEKKGWQDLTIMYIDDFLQYTSFKRLIKYQKTEKKIIEKSLDGRSGALGFEIANTAFDAFGLGFYVPNLNLALNEIQYEQGFLNSLKEITNLMINPFAIPIAKTRGREENKKRRRETKKRYKKDNPELFNRTKVRHGKYFR